MCIPLPPTFQDMDIIRSGKASYFLNVIKKTGISKHHNFIDFISIHSRKGDHYFNL